MSVEIVYRGSDRRYYTPWQVDEHLVDGTWKPCLEDRNTGHWLLGTEDDTLVMLTPVEPDTLPQWLEIHVDGESARVVDTRGAVP